MAGARNKPADAPAPQAVALKPPPFKRVGQSTAPVDVVAGMVDMLDEGASNGLSYPDKKKATNGAVIYRRAIIRKLGGDPTNKDDAITKTIGSRVWQVTDDGPNKGRWVFSLLRRKPQDAAADELPADQQEQQ